MQDAAPLLMLLGALVLFWLLIVRPSRNQQRKMQDLQGSLQVGDRVVIGAGIFGTIVALHETTVDLQIAEATTVSVARQVVVRKVDETPETAETSEIPEASDQLDEED